MKFAKKRDLQIIHFILTLALIISNIVLYMLVFSNINSDQEIIKGTTSTQVEILKRVEKLEANQVAN